MSASPHPTDRRAVLQRAYQELRHLRERLTALERTPSVPIAVVGIGCRFPPDVCDLDAYWQLLRDGKDAVRPVPPERWDAAAWYDPQPGTPGKTYSRHGGFLDNVDRFDAAFFGIAPREAVSMDPQQRLLLEVAWEALEHAAYAPDHLAGSRTGVFVGIGTADYAALQVQSALTAPLDAYFSTGTNDSVAAGRIAYTLGLQGPALAVDTACSSALTALHLACQGLRRGECDLALAAGVNLMLAPTLTVNFAQLRMLAVDGRCKTFDAEADGYVRGEGCAVLVLKRLDLALAQGDRVWAVLRGSAINQDGRSAGLTAPNGPAQEKLLRAALAAAGLGPLDIGYVEAHGTGTALGDPIEVRALAAVLCEGRPAEQPLLLGSVKTNLGHLEATAGMAGLIKVILALQHEEIPPHLHLRQLNPRIAWEELPVRVPTTRQPWPSGPEPRRAGVSAFGFSGTNVHVIVEEAPSTPPIPPGVDRPAHLLCLSARTENALRELAGRWETRLAAETQETLGDVCFSANAGRAHFEHRLALLASSPVEVRERLAAFVAGRQTPGLWHVAPREGADPPAVAFLFTGQGSQFAGMGRQLYQTQPTFRRTLDRCAELLRPRLTMPLLDVLYPSPGKSTPLNETAFTQPALFALEYALAELWRSWGVEPTVVIGHSLGEYVAACVAGVLGLEDALRLVAERGRLMQSLPPVGAMAAVFADADRVSACARSVSDQLTLAAVNGPNEVVLSGPRAAVEAVLAVLKAEDVRAVPLAVSHAFHSSLMEPILDEFERVAREVTFAEPRIDFISNVTGRLANGREIAQAGYWRRHLRSTVQFQRGMETLRERGARLLVEIGPTPTLLGLARQTLGEEAAVWLPSLRRGREDWSQMLEGLGQLYVHGAKVDWTGFDRDYPRRRVPLPTYPFQRQRFWLDTPPPRPALEPTSPRLLGRRVRSPLVPDVVFESEWRRDQLPFLADTEWLVHVGVYLDMLTAAAETVLGTSAIAVEEAAFLRALVLPSEGGQTVQLVLSPKGLESFTYRFFSRPATEADVPWTLHATGDLRAFAEPESATVPLQAVQARCTSEQTGASFYEQMQARGFRLGPAARWIADIRHREGEALARMRLPTAADRAMGGALSPGLLESCVQLFHACLPTGADSASLYMLAGWKRLRFFGEARGPLFCQVMREEHGPEHILGTFRLCEETGRIVAHAEGAYLKRTRRSAWEAPAKVVVKDHSSRSVRVAIGTRGTLQELVVRPTERQPPGPGEVEIQVGAAGLSFRDVLLALDMLPDEEAAFGADCAGTIAAIGARVRDWNVGAAVIALAPGSLGSFVVADARLVARQPARLSATEAATLPLTYLTAWYGLTHLARLRPTDRVLIHAAAGGVGLAALHLARRIGATVFATASPAKWPVLRALGVEHIFHSRTLDFAAQVRARTEGQGVNVVLNSLAGEFIPRSLDVLAPGGRFLEIGKRESWDAARVAQRRPDVAYLPFDLSAAARQEPDLLGAALQEIGSAVETGQLPPLPRDVFPLDQMADAFRLMAQARHVGKVVLRFAEPPALASELRQRLAALSPTEGRALLREHVGRQAARVLGTDPTQAVPGRVPLADLGLDSVMGTELVQALSAALDLRLPATLPYNYPTVEALSGYLVEKVRESTAVVPSEALSSLEEEEIPEEVARLSADEVKERLERRLAAIEETLS